MSDGRRKFALRGKDSNDPQMGKGEMISVCTKDKSIRYVAPSVYSLPNEDYFRIRRNLKVKNLIQTVDKEVSSYVPKSTKIDHKFPTSVRRVIASLVPQLRRLPKNYFNSKEVTVLLQMYYTITEHRVRHMTKRELDEFLKDTLGITDPHVLKGLTRMAVQLFDSKFSIEQSGIPPINFILMLSVYLRGSLVERAEMAFKIMDIDQDGILRKNYEFVKLLRGSIAVNIATIHPGIDPYQPIRDSIQYLENIFEFNSDGVDMKRFKEVALQQPWIIDCLLPITCQDVNKLVLHQSFFA
ncbi:hypothetical protein ACTXT7_013569 [Hymenolepis weldensis]